VGKRIVKGQTLTDWSRRPLTEEQLRYAVEDVAHLPAIHARLAAMLEKNGRAAWAGEEFRRFEDARLYQPPPGERLFRIKGTKNLDPLALVALEKLIEWRETWAREKNRPTRAMMRDDILVEIARRRPTRAEQLEVMRGFPQSRNPRIIAKILEIIAAAKAVPPEKRPVTKEVLEESPMTRVVVDVLAAVLRSTCHTEHLDADLVGSTQRLRDLLDFTRDGGDRPSLLTGWREQFIGARLLDVLAGRSELHLSGWPQNPHLSLVTHKGKTRAT
jgi:ribonuclease D